MAGSAADQLRALVEAAEREARESREGLERVGGHADELARRLDELTAGVAEALAALRDEIAALRAAGEPEPKSGDDELIAEAEAVAAREPDVEAPEPAAPEPEPAEPAAPEPKAAAPESAAPEPAAPEPAAPEPEAPAAPEGARLLALKMALDGRPRAETAAYLRENFELAEPDALLDEVYARAEARK